MDNTLKIAATAVEPAGKASSVHTQLHTDEAKGRYNEPFASFICSVGKSKIKRRAGENVDQQNKAILGSIV